MQKVKLINFSQKSSSEEHCLWWEPSYLHWQRRSDVTFCVYLFSASFDSPETFVLYEIMSEVAREKAAKLLKKGGGHATGSVASSVSDPNLKRPKKAG